MLGIRRRDFISLFGCAAAWPIAARGQQEQRIRHLGALMPYGEHDPDSQANLTAFQQGLEKLGWIVGRNLSIVNKWGIVDFERARAASLELLTVTPDVILATGTPSVQGVLSVTRTIPTVFTLVTEPVAFGFVDSLARPGGNLTGFTYLAPGIAGKWLELLREIAPQVTRVGFVFNPPANPYGGLFYGAIQLAAAKFAIQTTSVPVHEPAEFEQVIAMVGREPGGGLIIGPDAFTSAHRRQIVELAARYRVPAVYSRRFFATDGGLVVYGVDDNEHFSQVATYTDRILRGEKPADLPVQGPSRYGLVINLKTAKALGLEIPPQLLARADEVIE
jgi:putative ABC transport system substrate-binding protein